MSNQPITANVPPHTKGLLIRWAPFYDSVVSLLTLGQSRRLRTMTIDLARLRPGKSLLDVGCGTGGVTIPGKIRVGKNGAAAGIDPSPEMVAVAGEKAARLGLDIDFRLGVIEALPYPDESFDTVTSSLMMHHLPLETQRMGLAEIYRVLKPGGRLLIADTNRPRTVFMKQFIDSLARRHGIQFGIEDFPEVLRAAGFASAIQLEERFFIIGFVSAVKPLAEESLKPWPGYFTAKDTYES